MTTEIRRFVAKTVRPTRQITPRRGRAIGGLGLCTLWLFARIAAAVDPAEPNTTGNRAEGSATGLEEVVVTSQKRSESLQDVPLSVAALTSEALEQRGISGVASLVSGDIPSVKVEPFAGNPSVLEVAVRGFTNPNGNDITNENLVPIYIDDVYYGRQISRRTLVRDAR
jgi:outer membrane receptor protein involved in Fe transport